MIVRLVPAPDLQRAALVARTYTLQDVVVSEMAVRRHHAMSDAPPNQPLGFTTTDSAKALLRDDGQRLLVTVKFEFVAGLPAEKPTDEFVRIALTLELAYEKAGPDAPTPPKADVQTFARVNGIYNAWPYIRELVASTLVRVGFMPLTLGSLVIHPAPEPAPARSK